MPLNVRLTRIGWKGEKAVKTQTLPFHSNDNLEYVQMQGEIESKEDDKKVISFSIITPEVPENILVGVESKKTLIFKTFLNYSKPIMKNQLLSFGAELRLSLRETAKKILDIRPITLSNYHYEAWSRLWQSRFGLSFSKAQGVINGDSINSTIYYILSQKAALPTETFTDLSVALSYLNVNTFKFEPESCYNGHSTLQAPALWSHLDSINDVNRIVALWLLTLEKKGCQNLINSGVLGTMQAYILSLSAFKFTKNHLEFDTHPKDLHRNYFIRHLRYPNSSYLDINVSLGEDNKASIYVTLDQSDGKLCVDSVHLLVYLFINNTLIFFSKEIHCMLVMVDA